MARIHVHSEYRRALTQSKYQTPRWRFKLHRSHTGAAFDKCEVRLLTGNILANDETSKRQSNKKEREVRYLQCTMVVVERDGLCTVHLVLRRARELLVTSIINKSCSLGCEQEPLLYKIGRGRGRMMKRDVLKHDGQAEARRTRRTSGADD